MTKSNKNILMGLTLFVLVFIIGSIVCIIKPGKYQSAFYHNSPYNRLEHDFIKYLDDSRIFYSSRNTEYVIMWLYKDANENNETNLVLDLAIGNKGYGAQKKWSALTVEEKKTDLTECAHLLEEFLNKKKINYRYHIYITIHSHHETGNYVYDTDNDIIWIPNCEKRILNGEDIDNIATDALREEEGYTVYILDGEFIEHNKEYSTAY